MLSQLTELRAKNLGPERHNCRIVIAGGSILGAYSLIPVQTLRVSFSGSSLYLSIAIHWATDYIGDVIVNAANEGCTGGFGVDEQINRAAGYQLKEARKLLNGCETGDAKVTPSFGHRKCNHIIHAVGPVYRIKFGSKFGNEPDCLAPDQETYLASKDHLLMSAYKRSLKIAEELEAKTIGFTLLSAGVFKGERSLGDILEIGLETVIDNTYEGLEAITLVAWTEEEKETLIELFDKLLT